MSRSSCGIADRPRKAERTLQWRYRFPRSAARDEGVPELGQRLRLAERDAELAEHRGRLIKFLSSLVVPEGEAVGEREAAQRLSPFEHAAVRRRLIEGLPQEVEAHGGVAGAEGGGRARQPIVERGA